MRKAAKQIEAGSVAERTYYRYARLVYEAKEHDGEYQRKEKQYSQVFDEIGNRLGKNRKLMLKLERWQNEISSVDCGLIYLQGFIDCVMLLKLIQLM